MSRNIEKYYAGNNCAMRRNHATSSVISRLTDGKPLRSERMFFPSRKLSVSYYSPLIKQKDLSVTGLL